jgi:hypothetical protein
MPTVPRSVRRSKPMLRGLRRPGNLGMVNQRVVVCQRTIVPDVIKFLENTNHALDDLPRNVRTGRKTLCNHIDNHWNERQRRSRTAMTAGFAAVGQDDVGTVHQRHAGLSKRLCLTN